MYLPRPWTMHGISSTPSWARAATKTARTRWLNLSYLSPGRNLRSYRIFLSYLSLVFVSCIFSYPLVSLSRIFLSVDTSNLVVFLPDKRQNQKRKDKTNKRKRPQGRARASASCSLPYTRSPLEDSRLFGPSPWKVLAATNEKDASEQLSPWRKSSKREFVLWRQGVQTK